MMNDALMQFSSRHNNPEHYLTGFARRALFVLMMLIVSVGNLYAQTDLDLSMFNNSSNCVYNKGIEVTAGGVIFGENSGGVPEGQYADLTSYDQLVVTYDNTKATPRFLFNKSGDNTLIVESAGDYMTINGNKITIHLAKLASDNGGIAHLNCIKSPWGGSSLITAAQVENVPKPVTISKTIAVGSDNMIQLDGNLLCDHIPYNYIRIELVQTDDYGTETGVRYLTPAGNGVDLSQTAVSVATFRVESQYGDQQNTYVDKDGNYKFAYGSHGQWYDGIIVSSGTFTFKLPNRYDYRKNHLRIHLSRFNDDRDWKNNPPAIEKTYDYTLWIAGNEAGAQVHNVLDKTTYASKTNFTVDFYNLTQTEVEANILNHFGKSDFSNFDNFYLRWYLADKLTHQPIVDKNGNPISVKSPVLNKATEYATQFYQEDIGILWYLRAGWVGSSTVGAELSAQKEGVLKVNVNLESIGLTRDDIELVALVSDDYTNSDPGAEPSNLMHKYVVSFVNSAEIDYMNLPFRHYRGVTGRNWVTPEGSTGTMTQSIWTADPGYNKLLPTTSDNDPTKGSKSDNVTIDARQSVHTWEYDVYVTPGDGRRALILPFENYMYGYQTGISADGNDLEPRAYFRWYDWKTDLAVAPDATYTFEACNPDILKPYTESDYADRDRGLVALNLDPSFPTHGRVGVWLTVTDEFVNSHPNGIDIACDVSKYLDGIKIFGTNAYLEHEPTLSMRYIFHIYPGKKIADEMAAAKANLSKARQVLENTSNKEKKLSIYTTLEYLSYTDDVVGEIQPMFALPEDEGRVVVSLGAGKTGNFSLRLDENTLDNYKLWDGSNLVSADGVKWVAFYEDEKNGDVLRKELTPSTNTNRIQSFSYSDFQGDFYPLGSSSTTNVTDGMKFHVIGYVTSGTGVNTLTGTGVYAPVTHYELQFLVAPPLSVQKLKDNTDNVRTNNITRTDEYMVDHYDLQNVVDFNGNPETNKNLVTEPNRKYYFYSSLDGNGVLDNGIPWDAAPNKRWNNMSWLPREWTDIEYSYCYPQLTDYVIDSREGYWCYNHFLSPFHGDYMISESMNVTGISESRVPPYELQWWWGTELHDYTYVTTDGSKSGSFLYTDASNESRTMVTIPFDAELCAGSSIYFTAAVADMTNAQTKPQLLIRILGVDGDGNRSNVVSFHTCDISTTGAETGGWYQVYGESSIPINFDSEIDHFICEVVNYASNTNGADFAIDQFQIYTNTAKIKISQDSGNCDDPESNKMFIYAEAEGIQALYGRSGDAKIYWRIHDESGEPVTAEKMYSDSDDGSGIYAMTTFQLDYTNHMYYNNNLVDEATVKANDNLHWFMGDDGKAYLKIAYRYLPGLLDGETYYVSIYDPALTKVNNFVPENNAYWGGLNTAARSKCSVFSSFFIPRQQFVVYVNDAAGIGEDGHINVACGAAPIVSDMQMRLKKPDMSQPSGFSDVNDLHFDYFFGTIVQWASNDKFDANYTYQQLREAVEDYRATFTTDVGINESYSNATYKSVLQAAVSANLLVLANSTTFSNNFNERPSKDFSVVCLPVEKNLGDGTAICSPFVVKFDIRWPKPEMELGFPDVQYPQEEGLHRVIRIGLEQLNNLRNNQFKLHIPIHDFKDKDKNGNTGTLYFKAATLTISKLSDDPIGPPVGTNFAMLTSPNSSSSHGSTPFVDADHMFLVLDLSGNNCQINFHEGYTYEVSTSFYDLADNQSTPCYEDLYLTIKVVPEYVTWDPQQIESSDYYNVNWNNDDNWNRSERAEMYMDGADTHQQNTPTTWRNSVPEGGTYYYGDKYYKNATEINENLSSGKAFVPMKFTHVTLPASCHAPSLITMELVAYNTSPYTGGALLAGNLITDPSPIDPSKAVNSPATPDILYDMLVRYSEEVCQGHLKSDKTTVYGEGTANVYDCEKFYGNICKEIYFKPEAELLRQHRLTYEKAWVEKELVANKWYLLSAPLKYTYAGDMYVPEQMTDVSLTTPATVKGRQVSEAFQPINFDKSKGYSRTNYPIYQRSWGNNNGKVYVKENDPRANSYSANLGFGAVTTALAEWGHTFNDVQVPYSTLTGFSIRAHKKDQKDGDNDVPALIRLPKADLSYEYYDWTDTNSDPAAGTGVKTVTKSEDSSNANRLVTDDQSNDGTLEFSISNMQQIGDYVLVGNPFMSSIDMEKFFETNNTLGTGYWTYEAGVASAQLTTGIVRPLQGFFVKKGSATSIIFDKGMQIDGNFPTPPSGGSGTRQMALALGAKNASGSSSASIVVRDLASADYVSGEDVETLFDSNLSDVPMVYTVAGSRAVSIDSRPSLDVVPFGVTCASSNEPVDVTFDNGQWLKDKGQLFVLDAVTGSVAEITEGSTYAIQPNDYGRYFLTTHSDMTAIRETTALDGIVVSVRGRQLTVNSASELKSVRVMTTGGETIQSLTGCNKEVTFSLTVGGVYIIEAETEHDRKTRKVIVK